MVCIVCWLFVNDDVIEQVLEELNNGKREQEEPDDKYSTSTPYAPEMNLKFKTFLSFNTSGKIPLALIYN